MKVSELIDKLSALPSDSDVLCLDFVGAAGTPYYFNAHFRFDHPWDNEENPRCVIIEGDHNEEPRY